MNQKTVIIGLTIIGALLLPISIDAGIRLYLQIQVAIALYEAEAAQGEENKRIIAELTQRCKELNQNNLARVPACVDENKYSWGYRD